MGLNRLRAIALVVIVAALSAACASDSVDSAPTTQASTTSAPATDADDERSATVAETSSTVAAQQASESTDESVPWPDGAFESVSPGHFATWSEGSCLVDTPDEGADTTCGTLDVPLVRSDPSSLTRVEIPVMVVHAIEPTGPPVLFIDGGPGSPTLESLDDYWDVSALWDLHGDRDVVLFDTRGSGFTDSPVLCSRAPGLLSPSLAVPGHADMDDAAAAEEFDRWVSLCRLALKTRFDDGEISSFSVSNSVGDIEDIRRALGIDEWHLFGVSYGTRVALHTYRAHPESVVSLILDSVIPPDEIAPVSGPSEIERSLGHLDEACERSDGCRSHYLDIVGLYGDALERIGMGDLTIHKAGEEVRATELDLQSVVAALLYQSFNAREIPALLTGIVEADADYVSLLGAVQTYADEDESLLQLVQLCLDEVLNREESGGDTSVFDAHLVVDSSGAVETCGALGLERGDPAPTDPIVPAIPVLTLGGTFDPVARIEWSRDLAAAAPRGRFVRLLDRGHAEGDACSDRLVAAFARRPDQPFDTTCETVPLEFVSPTGGLGPDEPLDSFLGHQSFVLRPMWLGTDPGLINVEFDLPWEYTPNIIEEEVPWDLLILQGAGLTDPAFIIQFAAVRPEELGEFTDGLLQDSETPADPWTELGGIPVLAHAEHVTGGETMTMVAVEIDGYVVVFGLVHTGGLDPGARELLDQIVPTFLLAEIES
ncbi:MAG: alpha/beta fold hydrolase [Actinomycetia bacterium]|nr:alpha/beta fold hydrolase [Actinomycetes bacterium]